MDNSAIGWGITFEVETTPGSNVYEALAEVHGLTPPENSTDSVEGTHMTSASGVREFFAGLTDPGEVVIAMNWKISTNTDTLLRAWQAARETRGARINFPANLGGDILGFDCFVTNYGQDTPIDDRCVGNLTAKVTGPHAVT